MNLVKLQYSLQRVPDEALVDYVKNPQPHVPSYMALSELQRRQELRKGAVQPEAANQPSVADEVIQNQEMQGGLGSLAGGDYAPEAAYASQGLAGMDTGEAVPENFAGGGMIAFEEGGEVPGFADGVYIAPTMYDPRQEYIDRTNWRRAQEVAKKYGQPTQGYAEAGVQTPYDEAINYYKSIYAKNPFGAAQPGSPVMQLERRREAWLKGQPDPITGEAPVGSKYNVAGVPTTEKAKPAPTPAVEQPRKRVDLATDTTKTVTDSTLYPEQKAKTLGDYAKELTDYLGPDTSRAAQEERLAKREKSMATEKDKAAWMSLAEAGFGMMQGRSPFALQNIGAGAQMGLKTFMAAQRDFRNEAEKLDNLRYEIAKADRAEKLAMGKFGADSKQAYEERVAKERLLDKEMAARLKMVQIQEQGDNARAILMASAKGAEKQPTLTEKLKLEEYVESQMPAKEKAILEQLGSNSSKPGSKNYNEYVRRMAEERAKIRAGVGIGSASATPSYVYDPSSKTIR